MRKYFAVLCVWMVFVSAAGAAVHSWSGKWNVFWQEGVFVAHLQQHGNEVNGTYQPNDGTIEAKAEGNTLKGVSKNRQWSQSFVFTMSADGNAFFGMLQSGEWVSAVRVTQETNLSSLPKDTATPIATLYTFLKLGNRLRNGEYEALESGTKLVHYTPTQRKLFYGKRMILLRKFFQTLDMCTIHKFDFPSKIEGSSVTVTFHQAGTDNSVDVTFHKEKQRNAWRMVMPEEKVLDAKLKTLLAAYGLEEFDPHRNLLLTNPRDTIRTFIEQNKRWERGGKKHVIETMNLSAVDPAIWEWQAPLLAHYLLGVINRIGNSVYQEIPNNPKSRIPYVYFYHPLGSIVIAPYEEEGKVRWQFTPETLAHIERLYEAMERLPVKKDAVVRDENLLYFTLKRYAKSISPVLVKKIYDTSLWQIILLVLIVLFAFFLSYVSKWLTFAIVKRFYLTKRWSEETITLRFLRPSQMIVFALVLLFGAHQLGLSDLVFSLIKTFSYLLIVIGATWILYNLITIMFTVLQIHARRTSTDVDEIIVSLSGSIVRILLITAALFAVAEVLHIPYKTVLAGLGIGGLAFAIAAKDTIANFFGSAIIIADRPFKTGDRIKIGDEVGKIINVGIRSTKIRTTRDTVLTIPNNKITQEMIDNYSEREAMRVDTRFLFALDTPKSLLDEIDVKIAEYLQNHPDVDSGKIILTGVNDYTEHGILYELRFFVKAKDELAYSDMRHRIVTEIGELVKEEGIELVFIQHFGMDDDV